MLMCSLYVFVENLGSFESAASKWSGVIKHPDIPVICAIGVEKREDNPDTVDTCSGS